MEVSEYDSIFDESIIDQSNNDINISVINSNGNIINFKGKIGDDLQKQIDDFCERNNYSKDIKDKIEKEIQKKIKEETIKYNEDNFDSEKLNNIEENNLIRKEKNNYLNDSDSLIKIENIEVEDTNYKKQKNEFRNKNKSFETIYERNMKFNENKNRKIQNLKNELNKQESFFPSLNNYNKILNKSSDNILNGKLKLSVEDRLLMLGKKSKKKLSKITQLYYNNDFEENTFTFTPKINKYKRKNENKNVYFLLYENAEETRMKIEEKKEKLFKKFTFKPEINQNSKNMEISSFKKILSENKKLISKEIIIKPTKKIKKNNLNLNEKKEEKKNEIPVKTIVSKEVNYYKKNWIKHINEKIEKQKMENYKNIFDILDSNKNNFISYKTIDTSKFNKKILSIISPIINEIIENKEEMVTFKEFTEKAEKIIPQKMFKK